jgi:hypothetical protein
MAWLGLEEIQAKSLNRRQLNSRANFWKCGSQCSNGGMILDKVSFWVISPAPYAWVETVYAKARHTRHELVWHAHLFRLRMESTYSPAGPPLKLYSVVGLRWRLLHFV